MDVAEQLKLPPPLPMFNYAELIVPRADGSIDQAQPQAQGQPQLQPPQQAQATPIRRAERLTASINAVSSSRDDLRDLLGLRLAAHDRVADRFLRRTPST